MNRPWFFLVGSVVIFSTGLSISACTPTKKAQPADDQLMYGASVYVERCSLCHGSRGLGEGPIPLMVQDYPDTNLRTLLSGLDPTEIETAVRHGGSAENRNSYSPPWYFEFTENEIDAITQFVAKFDSHYDEAITLLDKASVKPKLAIGRKIYLARCQRCHGKSGQGDGPILARQRVQPYSDLTVTTLSYEDILQVITLGGPALGRSKTMPPWGQELADAELASIAKYVQSLSRNSKQSKGNGA